MKILIVEDERHLADGLKFNLQAEGYEADVVSDGHAALELLVAVAYDAVVLDVMLPTINGFEVVRDMRRRSDFTPVMMLTARGRPEDVLQGFDAGADEYLAKPFNLDIFLARLNGLLRRRSWSRSDEPKQMTAELSINGRVIDFKNLELRNGSETVNLTLMEARLLHYLVENAGRAVSRSEILEKVWDLQEDTDTRAIDNFIVRLRRHLEEEPSEPKIVKTVRGVGYKYVAPDQP